MKLFEVWRWDCALRLHITWNSATGSFVICGEIVDLGFHKSLVPFFVLYCFWCTCYGPLELGAKFSGFLGTLISLFWAEFVKFCPYFFRLSKISLLFNSRLVMLDHVLCTIYCLTVVLVPIWGLKIEILLVFSYLGVVLDFSSVVGLRILNLGCSGLLIFTSNKTSIVRKNKNKNKMWVCTNNYWILNPDPFEFQSQDFKRSGGLFNDEDG